MLTGSSLTLSAEVVHRGWRHLSPGWGGRADGSAERLRAAGLQALAGSTADLVARVRTVPDPAAALEHWADHHLRLLVP